MLREGRAVRGVEGLDTAEAWAASQTPSARRRLAAPTLNRLQSQPAARAAARRRSSLVGVESAAVARAATPTQIAQLRRAARGAPNRLRTRWAAQAAREFPLSRKFPAKVATEAAR